MLPGNVSLARDLEISLKIWARCLHIVPNQTAGHRKIPDKCENLPPHQKKNQAREIQPIEHCFILPKQNFQADKEVLPRETEARGSYSCTTEKSTLRDVGRWGRFLSLLWHVAFGLVFSLPCATVPALAFAHLSGWAITVLNASIQLFLLGRKGPVSHLGPQHIISVLLAASPFSLKNKDKNNGFPFIICKLSKCYLIFHQSRMSLNTATVHAKKGTYIDTFLLIFIYISANHLIFISQGIQRNWKLQNRMSAFNLLWWCFICFFRKDRVVTEELKY